MSGRKCWTAFGRSRLEEAGGSVWSRSLASLGLRPEGGAVSHCLQDCYASASAPTSSPASSAICFRTSAISSFLRRTPYSAMSIGLP